MSGLALAAMLAAMLVGVCCPVLIRAGLVKSRRGQLAIWSLVTLAGVVIWFVSDQFLRR